jgi:predicted phosphodiesterase
MRYFLKFLFVLICIQSSTATSQTKKIVGFVFHDLNKNEVFDANEKGIPSVAISNGSDVVVTDKNGKYSLKIDDDTTVFLIKPSRYISKLSTNFVPENYAFNKPKGSPDLHFKGVEAQTLNAPLNFPLYKNEGEDELKIGLLGDIQAKTIDDVYYLSKAVSEKMLEEEYDFLVPLGDITFDNLRLFEPIKSVLGKVGAPVYYIYGNHDRNYDGENIDLRDETYERNFGPSYYAFNYGSHTFIALNNIFPKPHHEYDAKIDDKQMQFVKGLLKTVPKENTIHLLMHIPLEQLINLEDFSNLFKKHPNVHAYAGHTHTQFFETIKKEDGWLVNNSVEELVAGALCGSWWHGEKDSFGIPASMMADGTPKGFWIMNLKGNKKTYDYKVSEPDNRQMHIWTPFEFDRELIPFNAQKIIANVYAGNESTTVEIKIGDGTWEPMIYTNEIDPFFKRLHELQNMGITPSKNSIKLGKPKKSLHLWSFPIPEDLAPGIHLISIKAKNNYGLDVTAKTMLFNKTDNEQFFIKK